MEKYLSNEVVNMVFTSNHVCYEVYMVFSLKSKLMTLCQYSCLMTSRQLPTRGREHVCLLFGFVFSRNRMPSIQSHKISSSVKSC